MQSKYILQLLITIDYFLFQDAMYKSLTDAQKMAALYERMEVIGGGGKRTKPLPINPQAASK